MRLKLAGFILLFLLIVISFFLIKKHFFSDKPSVIVCFGNSLTAGHGAIFLQTDDKENSYPAFLQKLVNDSVINAGVTGNTTAEGLARINEDVLSHNPNIVIIELGANDFFQMIPLSETRENLQKIINSLTNGNRKIYIVKFYTESIAKEWLTMFGIEDIEFQIEVIKQYDEMFDSMTQKNNIEIIENIWNDVWGIHMSDEIHPNARGYEIMAGNILKGMKEKL